MSILIAMSTLAFGAIRADEAYGFINSLNIQSVVFGASQEKNRKETAYLIGGAAFNEIEK